MTSILRLTLLATAFCAVAAPSAGAVVGGTPAAPETLPWLASVGGCGGTLVAPDRVLTAAHCVAGQSPATGLRAVSVGAEVRGVTGVALHPNWRAANGPQNFLDDVAIVGLDRPVEGVTPVVLGGPAVAEATITGRGRPFAPGTGHSEAETFDGTLRSATLRTIDDAACAAAFKGYQGSSGERFDPRMRCSIDPDGAEPLASGCNGDSGGPLWTGPAAAPVQLGVVSWGGDRCGADHLPSVFADVARYRAFVLDPSPTWAPQRTAKAARIDGVHRAGRRLTCSAPGYTPEAGARLAYVWSIVGRGRGGYSTPDPVGGGRRFTLPRTARGHRVACFVRAVNDGGYVLAAAATVVVPAR
jgi:secreted trypsin-like serine protease